MLRMERWFNGSLLLLATASAGACGTDGPSGPGTIGSSPAPLPAASCDAVAGGSTEVAKPELIAELSDRYHESWQGSPAVADLDGDGSVEIAVPRHNRLNIWSADGELLFSHSVEGRIWAAPVVVDLLPERDGLEIAVAARSQVYAWDAKGEELPGFPVEWRDELRSLAAGDIDGDGRFELVTATTRRLEDNGQRDLLMAIEADGSFARGFPPNTSGASECDDACYVTGGFDQNLAIGDLDGDGVADVAAVQDNAYISIHDGTGRAFDCADIFRKRTKVQGVRFMLDYDEAQQGFADDEDSANQAHFTNSSPAIADIDGDGEAELVFTGSVQNASQDDRERGVVLFVVRPDGTRPDDWVEPYYVPEYRAGLNDFDGTNVVGLNNSVTVVDIDPERAGLEMIFADYDGRIHAVDARGEQLWTYRYTSDARVLTGGVVVSDLSRDGVPEVVFATYSPDQNKGELFVLDAGGNELHTLALPTRGAMGIPTIADVDGDGTLEIVVSLKGNEEDGETQVEIYTVASSAPNCMPWPTSHGSLRRDGLALPTVTE